MKGRMSLSALMVFAIVAASPLRATEPTGDLVVQLRLLGVESVKGRDAAARGVARIEASLIVRKATEDIQLEVVTPDRSRGTAASKSFDPEPVSWRRVDGNELSRAPDGRLSAGAGEIARTILLVPLEGAKLHEIIVRVRGEGPDGPLSWSARLTAPLGIEEPVLVEKDGVATMQAKGGAR